MIVITTSIGFYNISCHISGIVKKRPYAKSFGLFGIIAIIGSIHDGFLYLSKFSGIEFSLNEYTGHIMIFQYTCLGPFIGTALVLVFRFISVMNEIEDLNMSLENFVIDNALLNERIADTQNKKSLPLNITFRTEEKIKKVMNYIEENYSSDISREGLAASVDVHPDNLGKLFKTYTNKKLGDYIYELRVKDAAIKLRETDDNIIDIAFSVGFESLRTFNRIFPKFMGTTPEKYRKHHSKNQS
jgi:YesN/AraC family two-component response regulator